MSNQTNAVTIDVDRQKYGRWAAILLFGLIAGIFFCLICGWISGDTSYNEISDNIVTALLQNYNYILASLVLIPVIAYIYSKIKAELNKNLTVTRDASNFFIVTVDNYTDKENTFVKDKLLSYLKQGEIPFFKDKTIVELSENTKDIFAPVQETQSLSIKKIVIYLVGGGILFAILGTILAAVFSRKNTVINDDFSFLTNDQVVNISHFSNIDKQVCIENTLMNIVTPTIILTQLQNLNLRTDNNNIIITDDLGNAFLPSFEARKILLICEKGETTKEWYQLQMELSKIYSDDIDIILI